MADEINGLARPADERVVTLIDVVAFFRIHGWKLILTGVICGAVAAGLGFMMHRVYRATVVVTPAGSDEMRSAISRVAGGLGGLASLAGVSLPEGSKDKEEALAILKSRSFAQSFIRDQGLMTLIFQNLWDAKTGKWKVSSPEDVPTMQDAVEIFEKKIISIVEDRDRGLVTLSTEWRDREQVAAWANLLIARVNEQLRARRLAELDRNIAYLNREIDKTSVVELRNSLYHLVETQINERMVASVRSEYAFRVIDPAVVPDIDRYVWPRKALMAALGFAIGIFGCGLWIFAVRYSRAYAPAKSS
jgi:uncharacterized protein involved in exopolysaccharide biosynthesis